MRQFAPLRSWLGRVRCRSIVLLAGYLILNIVACGPPHQATEGNPLGGTLYVGVEASFHGFDVLGTSGFINPTQAPLNNLLMEPLFRMDRGGNLIPVLGKTATPSTDGRLWDIELRQGVVFNDGSPFNADAVIQHWSRILNPANRYKGRPTFRPINRVEKTGEWAVRFHLDHPWPPFPEVISDELLLFNFIPSPAAVDAGVHDRKPVGTGPFKYHQWNFGDHFVVLKNENYWQPGKPLLNKVVFRAVPDHQTRFASLLSGEIDIITLDRGNLIQKARKDPALTAFETDSNGAEIILINTASPPLDDVRVRRALAMGNNQALHIKMVYGDTIPFVHHPFGGQFACEDDGYLPYDPAQARRLIADYGQPVKIEFLHSNTSRGRDIGAIIQRLYKEIGVTVMPVPLSTGPQVMKVIQQDFQMATWRIPPSRDHGPQLYRSFHSGSPTNFSGYANAELDRLLDMQRVETDAATRDDLWCRIIRQLNGDVPFLYRGGRRFHYVTRKKVMNMMDTPGLMVDLASAWLDETIKFNPVAYQIEQEAVVGDVDCPEPGDTERIKTIALGTWEGKDNWGASIKATFNADGTVVGGRKGNVAAARKFIICGSSIHWTSKSGANVMVTVPDAGGPLTGQWEYASYTGQFTLTRVNFASSNRPADSPDP